TCKICDKYGHIARHCPTRKVNQPGYSRSLTRCQHCKSSDYIRKEDCIEIKLLKQQQTKNCNCPQEVIQRELQKEQAEENRRQYPRNTYHCCKCQKPQGYQDLTVLTGATLYET